MCTIEDERAAEKGGFPLGVSRGLETTYRRPYGRLDVVGTSSTRRRTFCGYSRVAFRRA